MDSSEIVELFLDGAHRVSSAISAEAVRAAWADPSVLEEQQVGGLVGHLARGGVWVVAEYLDLGVPIGAVDFNSAAAYFAHFVTGTTADHRAIRKRGATLGALGPAELLRSLQSSLAELEPRLRALDPGSKISVIGGRVMRLDDYLPTRIVEQTVHLDDLARSSAPSIGSSRQRPKR